MERLTFDGNFCDIARCGETRYGSFCEDGTCSQRKVWERLKEYEDAEQDKRILVLPCPIGSTLWRVCKVTDRGTTKIYPRAVELNKNNFWRIVIEGEFGKTVFLTVDEAWAKIRKMEAAEWIV